MPSLSCRVNGQNGVVFFRMDLSWISILSMPPSLLSSCLGASYNILPSPSNLHRWNISTENSWQLYHKQICTSAHILRIGACEIAFHQRRFTFQHGSVLYVLLSTFQSFLSSYTVFQTNFDTSIKFVKAWPKPEHSIKKKVNLLHFASDWILHLTDIDHLDNKLVIPSFITVSQLRPGIVIYSPSKLSSCWNSLVLVSKIWKCGTTKILQSIVLCF